MANAEPHDNLQNSICLSHHVNARSKARRPSPLKDIIHFMSQEGMISFAGGLPHPSLFPIHGANFVVSNVSPGRAPESNDESVLELSSTAGSPTLANFLQYGNGAGNPQLRQWCLDFTLQIHRPPYKDVEVLLHPGNTNAWSKVVGLLCEEGDHILCESFTYPSAQALWIPLGNFAAPVPMDGQGIRPDALDQMLANWDATHRGVRRPHVLYLVGVGSNPSGTTMREDRKRMIYSICVKYDIIIVEDDPYYFIQYSTYGAGSGASYELQPNDAFKASLAPSFLRYDYQGRVIRLESFSKSIAPGLRLGYFVANSAFTERLLRATEVETQDPAGLSQAVVLSILRQWTADGYLTWLQNLSNQYQLRRDWMISAFAKNFELLPASAFPDLNADGLVAAMKTGSGSVPIFSFVPPVGGMFIWAMFHFSANPRFKELQHDSKINDPEQTFANELWMRFAENLVLLTPGSYYHPWQGADKVSTQARGADPEMSHFRFSFAMVTRGDIDLGAARMAEVVKSSWKL